MTALLSEWIADNFSLILIISGAATCSMIAMMLSLRFSVRFIFGENIASASGALIASAWHPEFRLPVLLNAIAGKLCFTLLVFAGGRRFLARPAFAMALADLVMVGLFVWYLAER
jgi:hypothetical protein